MERITGNETCYQDVRNETRQAPSLLPQVGEIIQYARKVAVVF
jgi:hypothetical protein